VDCTAPVRQQHLDVANRMLPEQLQIDQVRDLLPGAPSLGKMVAAARYLLAPRGDHPWPASPDALEPELLPAITGWTRAEDGSVRVELNLRQGDGPVGNLKAVLAGLGVPAEGLPRVHVVREALVLRPPTRAS
jgi:hypothetical protein